MATMGRCGAMRTLVGLLVAFTALAGCSDSDGPRMDMDWDDRSHAHMSMRHEDGHMSMMGRMAGMSMTGPNGTVPMHLWNGNGTCPMAQAQSCMMTGPMEGWGMHGGEHDMDMHAMMVDGAPGMVMMPEGMEHPAHEHVQMPPGDYTMRMQGMGDASARLT